LEVGKTPYIGNSVWYLIHSLTGHEKGAITRLLSQTDDDGNHRFLYHLLVKMIKYDHISLVNAYAAHTADSNISRALAKLKDYIYKNLTILYQETSGELARLVQEIHIANDKQDYESALKFCDEAKQIGWASESFGKLQEILNLEREVILADKTLDGRERKREANKREWKKLIAIEENYLDYVILEDKFYKYYKRIFNQTGEQDKVILLKLAGLKLMEAEANAISVKAKAKFYKLSIALAWVKGENKKSQQHAEAFMKLFNSNHWLKADFKNDYVIEVRKRIAIEFENGKLNEGLKGIEELTKISARSRREAAKIEGNILIAKFHYCVYVEDAQYLEGANKELHKNIDDILFFFEPENAHLLLYVAIDSAWRSRDFSRGYNWINRALSLQGTGVRQDIQLIARIYHLIFLLEEGDFKTISALSQTYLRYLKQIKWKHKLEKLLIGFFRNIEPETTQEQLTVKLQGFRGKLISELKASDTKRFEHHTGILQWLKDQVRFQF
jgi:hypothetical protein